MEVDLGPLEVFKWCELPPEIRSYIKREHLDFCTATMLGWTCKEEWNKGIGIPRHWSINNPSRFAFSGSCLLSVQNTAGRPSLIISALCCKSYTLLTWWINELLCLPVDELLEKVLRSLINKNGYIHDTITNLVGSLLSKLDQTCVTSNDMATYCALYSAIKPTGKIRLHQTTYESICLSGIQHNTALLHLVFGIELRYAIVYFKRKYEGRERIILDQHVAVLHALLTAFNSVHEVGNMKELNELKRHIRYSDSELLLMYASVGHVPSLKMYFELRPLSVIDNLHEMYAHGNTDARIYLEEMDELWTTV